jgi:hypothetical protein
LRVGGVGDRRLESEELEETLDIVFAPNGR